MPTSRGSEELFKRGYANSSDVRLKLALPVGPSMSTPPPLAKAEMSKLADWGRGQPHPRLTGQGADGPATRWVVVVMPNRADFSEVGGSRTYGPDAVGLDEHDRRGRTSTTRSGLVSMDLGATLRHEFLPCSPTGGDMTRRGADAPHLGHGRFCARWLKTTTPTRRANLHPTASWRTNIVKRLEKLGKLDPIEKIATLSPADFSGHRPLAKLRPKHGRFFLYLCDQGQAQGLVRRVTRPTTGRTPRASRPSRRPWGKPIKDVNKDYRAWGPKPCDGARKRSSQGWRASGSRSTRAMARARRSWAWTGRVPNRPRPQDGRTSSPPSTTGPRGDIAELVRVLSGYKAGDHGRGWLPAWQAVRARPMVTLVAR